MNSSIVSSQSTSPWRNLQQVMRQHALFSYFLLAYVISWIMFIPYVLAEWGILQGNYTIFYIFHTFGPALAAIVMTAIIAGQTGLHELRQRVRQWRAPGNWYLFMLAGIPALILLGIIVQPGDFPRNLVELLASSGLFDGVQRRRARHRLRYLPHELSRFYAGSFGTVNYADVDFQSHRGKYFHCDPGACQREYCGSTFDPTLSHNG